jgi:ABC-type antimicrobial peptide transport system permease subunit
LKLTIAGLALGFAGSILSARVLSGFLFGIRVTDPMTYLGTGAIFVAVALIASYLPARRALRVDPMSALRDD